MTPTDIRWDHGDSYGAEIRAALGLSYEQYENDFGGALEYDIGKYVYNDSTLYSFFVPSYIDGEQNTAAYAGCDIIVDVFGKKAKLSVLNVKGVLGGQRYAYSERIADVFYFDYGYYDITEKKIYGYGSPDDHPDFGRGGAELKDSLSAPDVYGLISSDCEMADYLEPKGYEYKALEDMYLGKYRYTVLGLENGIYDIGDNGERIYDGDTVYFVVTDASLNRVVYLERIKISNYWCLYAQLVMLDGNGAPYEAYLLDSGR